MKNETIFYINIWRVRATRILIIMILLVVVDLFKSRVPRIHVIFIPLKLKTKRFIWFVLKSLDVSSTCWLYFTKKTWWLFYFMIVSDTSIALTSIDRNEFRIYLVKYRKKFIQHLYLTWLIDQCSYICILMTKTEN